MAGASRTQVSTADAGLLFTLYEGTAGEGTWEYGFVHTLATGWSGVWRIDLPEDLQLAHSAGALALSQDERRLYVVSGEDRLAEIPLDDLGHLAVARTADLGVVSEDPPAVAAGAGVLWVALGGKLLAVDPASLEVVARADTTAPVRSLLAVATGNDGSPQGETVLAADTGQLRSWSRTSDDTALSEATSSVSLPKGLGTISRMVLPR